MQMRRMICAAFACILAVGTLAIPASAIENVEAVADDNVVHYGINELNPDDFIYIAPATVQRARTSYMRFEFPGAVYNSVYSDFIENVITAGASAILWRCAPWSSSRCCAGCGSAWPPARGGSG